MEKSNEQIFHRTEEVKDIIDRMPNTTGRFVALFVTGLALALILFGSIIDYPEKVSGNITIIARQAPVRLVSNAPGKIHLLKKNNEIIRENGLIAILDNPAKLKDVVFIDSFIIANSFEKLQKLKTTPALPIDLSLGDINMTYFSFLNSLEKVVQYNSQEPFTKRRNSYLTLLASQMRLQSLTLKRLNTNAKSLKIASKNVRRDSMLLKSATIAELDMERSAVNYLTMEETNQMLEKENDNIQMQIDDTRNRINILEIDRLEAEQKLRMDLFSGYNELINSIKKWKLTYAIIAPFKGKIEFLNFWHENDFIAPGTPIVSIIPEDDGLLGQVYLPSNGAGKVAVGQDVVIKLDNYPFNEYGSVKGQVKVISQLANQTEDVAGKNIINTYLITVDLPNKLTTNYGAILNFSSELKGVADILTKKRKLIHRLFDNLKYIASKK